MDERMADAPVGQRIDIVSDAICPWCYIGKRQLERALATLAPRLGTPQTLAPLRATSAIDDPACSNFVPPACFAVRSTAASMSPHDTAADSTSNHGNTVPII